MDQFSLRIQNSSALLWTRFLEALEAAELELADVPADETEITALLSELGFTAIERARLRRACNSKKHEPVQTSTAPACETEKLVVKGVVEGEAVTKVNECVFLTGDFFGDDAGLTVGSVVAAGLESPSGGCPAAAFDAQSEIPATPANLDENVFLTGDFFGDDVPVLMNSVQPTNMVMEVLSAIPPPPLAPPLLPIQSQIPLSPPPAEAPAFEQIHLSQMPLPSQPTQISLVDAMEQVVVESSTVQQPNPGFEQVPSIGSLDHHMGTCRPCAYFGVRGCENGAQCEYCHLCLPGELKRRQKVRRSAQRRMRYMDASEF